jgi:hypothetical protein
MALGTEAGDVGLSTALCSSVGKLVRETSPADARVWPTHCFHSHVDATGPDLPLQPQERNSSMVRVLIECRPWQPRRRRPAFDDEHLDAVPSQRDGGGQAGRIGSDHDDRHRGLGSGWRCGTGT